MQAELRVERARVLGATTDQATMLYRMNEASPRPSPFFTPEFIDTYLSCNESYLPREVEPFVLIARSGEEPVASLLLKRVWDRSLKVPFRRIEFLVASEVDLPPLLGPAAAQLPAARAFLRYLSRHLYRASVVDLVQLAVDSPLLLACDAARTPWAEVLETPGMAVSSIRRNHVDLEAYFRALSHKMRSNVSRLARRLLGEGRVEYLTATDPRVLGDLFDVYLDVEDRSWKFGTDASVRRHPRRLEMYRKLLHRSSHVNYHIDILLLDEVPIAAQLSMRYGRMLFAMETCYDAAWSELGPGNLMLLLAVQRCLRLGADELSLHGHFEYYKHRWLAETTETRELRILRKGSLPHARALAGATLRRLRGQAPRQPHTPHAQSDRPPPLPRPPTPAALALTKSLRAHPLVTHLAPEALRAALPFPARTKD